MVTWTRRVGRHDPGRLVLPVLVLGVDDVVRDPGGMRVIERGRRDRGEVELRAATGARAGDRRPRLRGQVKPDVQPDQDAGQCCGDKRRPYALGHVTENLLSNFPPSVRTFLYSCAQRKGGQMTDLSSGCHLGVISYPPPAVFRPIWSSVSNAHTCCGGRTPDPLLPRAGVRGRGLDGRSSRRPRNGAGLRPRAPSRPRDRRPGAIARRAPGAAVGLPRGAPRAAGDGAVRVGRSPHQARELRAGSRRLSGQAVRARRAAGAGARAPAPRGREPP